MPSSLPDQRRIIALRRPLRVWRGVGEGWGRGGWTPRQLLLTGWLFPPLRQRRINRRPHHVCTLTRCPLPLSWVRGVSDITAEFRPRQGVRLRDKGMKRRALQMTTSLSFHQTDHRVLHDDVLQREGSMWNRDVGDDSSRRIQTHRAAWTAPEPHAAAVLSARGGFTTLGNVMFQVLFQRVPLLQSQFSPSSSSSSWRASSWFPLSLHLLFSIVSKASDSRYCQYGSSFIAIAQGRLYIFKNFIFSQKGFLWSPCCISHPRSSQSKQLVTQFCRYSSSKLLVNNPDDDDGGDEV